MSKISEENIKEYMQVFGQDKMQCLWLEFTKDAQQKLTDIEAQNGDGQRLVFHSLRSSSLVFGMIEFSAFCQSMEESILNGKLVEAEQALKAQKLLVESIAEAEAYLK